MQEPDQQLDRDDLDLGYRQEYLRWVTSLSSTDRRQLIAMGLDKPHVERSSFVHARGETFRDPTGTVGTWIDDRGEGWRHPGLPVEEDEPDGIDTDDLEELGRCNPETLQVLMRTVFFADLGRGPQLKACFARLIAVAHALHIPGVGERSLTSLAEEIGVTRALLCHYAVMVRDFAKLDHAAGTSMQGREAYREAQLWRYRKRKAGVAGNEAEDAPQGTLEAKAGR